jgi:hypothetical protein
MHSREQCGYGEANAQSGPIAVCDNFRYHRAEAAEETWPAVFVNAYRDEADE